MKPRDAHVKLWIQQSEIFMSLDPHRRKCAKPLYTGIRIWVKNAEWTVDMVDHIGSEDKLLWLNISGITEFRGTYTPWIDEFYYLAYQF